MKYKKALLSFGTLLVALSPLASVVSCGNNFGPDYRYYGDIQVITDAGSIQDKSFNESSFIATREFAELETAAHRRTTFGFSQPQETTTILMQKAYLSALKAGSKDLVLPGFTHADATAGNAVQFAVDHHGQYPKARYINPDGISPINPNLFYTKYLANAVSAQQVEPYVQRSQVYNTKGQPAKPGDEMAWLDSSMFPTKTSKHEASKGYKTFDDLIKGCKQKGLTPLWVPTAAEDAANVLGGYYDLGYNAYESGFLSAIYGGGFFNEVKKVSSPIRAATFGGVAIPFGVTSYMDGYLQGIYWFNQKIGYKWSNGSWTPDPTKSIAKRTDGKNYQTIQPVFLGGNKASKADFTGSFEAGGATSKVLQLIDDKHAQMILPVAGPQTGDVVGVIKSKALQGDVFAIGVDTDQSLVYDPSIILGSAVKGIYVSTSYALKALTDNPNFGSFPSFGLGLIDTSTSESPFYQYVYGKGGNAASPKPGSLLDKLYQDAHGDPVKKRAAQIKVLPTGFAPSFKADKDPLGLENLIATTLLKTGQTWTDIEDEAAKEASATPDQASNNLAYQTEKAYGSFYVVATS